MGKRGFFAIKIDLKKVYDRLNWNFIKEVIGDIKLPERFCNLIMDCVLTTSFNVLWNGNKTNNFQPF